MAQVFQNGRCIGWGNVQIFIEGQVEPLTGVTKIEFQEETQITEEFGAGGDAVARGEGQTTKSGSISVFLEEKRRLELIAPEGRLKNLTFDVLVSYVPVSPPLAVIKRKLIGCIITRNQESIQTGDTKIVSDLPLSIGQIVWVA